MATPVDQASLSQSELIAAYDKLKRKKKRDASRALRQANERYQRVVEKADKLVDELKKVYELVPDPQTCYGPFWEHPRRAVEDYIEQLKSDQTATKIELDELKAKYEKIKEGLQDVCGVNWDLLRDGETLESCVELMMDLSRKEFRFDDMQFDLDSAQKREAELLAQNEVLRDRLAAIHRAHKGRPVPGCDTCEKASKR